MQLFEVAVAAPLDHPLTYAAPEDIVIDLLPGMRVLVPLGNRQITGYLLGPVADLPAEVIVKRIIDVLDTEPLFHKNMIRFYRWISGYYKYPLGEVIKTALPGGLTPRSIRQVFVTTKKKDFPVNPDFEPWQKKLVLQGKLTPAETKSVWSGKGRHILELWQQDGLVELVTKVSGDRIKLRKEKCIRICRHPLDSAYKPLRSETKTLAAIAEIAFGSAEEWISRRELTRFYPGAAKALPLLVGKGLVEQEEREVYRDPFGERPTFNPRPDSLTDEQTRVLVPVAKAIDSNCFTVFLLHGITGSGKTEVYLRAAEMALAKKKSVLVLVPEISLASQLEGQFHSRFPDQIAILHSGLSVGERYDQWMRLVRGRALIVIGARSAVFAPLDNIGLIIVDEEHDGAYKQEDGLRYNARDLAVLRASQTLATVILGSATPSITTYYHALTGKYRLLELTKRIENRPLPEVQIIDLKKIPTVSGAPPLFSNDLVNGIKETLAAGDQVLIFLNRRGFSNFMLCQDCGKSVQCRQCSVTMTLHQGRRELACHYCGTTMRSDICCPHCRSSRLVGVGSGTERVEDELAKRFPKARIARLDKDTATDRNYYIKIFKAVRERQIDILIGTQMIAKGLHFPNVTLVGIIWADASLGLPDFRAGERTFQLLAQVTGRAGRGEKPGRVIIQTHQPQHYSVVTAQAHDYQGMVDRELSLRRELGFPPFARLINFRIEGEEEGRTREAAELLAGLLKKLIRKPSSLIVLGPAPAPLTRLRSQYRWQILLKGIEVEALNDVCTRLLAGLPPVLKGKAIKLMVDVDPENML
ncbi:MAG: primosomal protein N' [Deltaproteobacteria bacterium RIFOXYD12_FULL_50_9]|nr:MAG: primosomal protein N' [Deltaproteobacteria bacterium RIFOXYD12_FULL_50_9]